MTGQDLINYIEEGKLQDKHFFINVEGYISAIGSVLETEIVMIVGKKFRKMHYLD